MIDSVPFGRKLYPIDHALLKWYARDQFGVGHSAASSPGEVYRKVSHREYIAALTDARTPREDDDVDTMKRRETIRRVMTPPEDLPAEGAAYFLAGDNKSGFGLDADPDEHGLHQGHGLWSIAGARGSGILDSIRRYVGNNGHRLSCFGNPEMDKDGNPLDPYDSFLPRTYSKKGYVPDEEPFGSDGPVLKNGVSTNWGDDPDGSHPELHNPRLPSVVFMKLPPKRMSSEAKFASLWLADSIKVGRNYL